MEERCRFDFRNTDDEIQALVNLSSGSCADDFNYLLDVAHLSAVLKKEGVDINSLSKNTEYADYVSVCEKEQDHYVYTEWWEDDKGNKAEKVRYRDKSGALDLPDYLPTYTRKLFDGIVVYDWRHQDDYVPAHTDENGVFVLPRHK